MDVQRGSIDSASDWHVGGMGSKLGEVIVAERRNGDGNEWRRIDIEPVGWIIIVVSQFAVN